MNKKRTDLGPKELNKDYFQGLGATRASVGMLGLAWLGLVWDICLKYCLVTCIFFYKKSTQIESLF